MNFSIENVQTQLKRHPSKELKAQLKNQAEQFSAEAKELKFSLKNNEELIQAHIKVIVLKDPSADAAHHSDISHSERFQSLWNDCKQEVEKMQQTQLTISCTAHDFLNKDLERLPDLSPKTLKSMAVQFPHYAPLLQMQSNMVDNYRLVQGPQPVKPTTEVRLPSISNHSLKDWSVSESKINETQKVSSRSKNSAQSQPASQKISSRLINSVFFGGSFQTEESVSKKTSERVSSQSRLYGSTFWATKITSDFSLVKEKSIDRTICISDSVKPV